MKYTSGSESETTEIAKTIVRQIVERRSHGPAFIGLIGELGAGKTAFVKGVAEFFDVHNTVLSPTFVIQKVYEIGEENRHKKNHAFEKLIHMDLYRLEDESKLHTIKWEEYKNDPGNIIFVEWPNQIWKDSPDDMIEIKINHKNENEREIIFEE